MQDILARLAKRVDQLNWAKLSLYPTVRVHGVVVVEGLRKPICSENERTIVFILLVTHESPYRSLGNEKVHPAMVVILGLIDFNLEKIKIGNVSEKAEFSDEKSTSGTVSTG